MKTEGKTTDELLAMRAAIEADPFNQMPVDSFFRFTDSARKKLDQIDREITANMVAAKKALGSYVEPSGYSGRQTNKRR